MLYTKRSVYINEGEKRRKRKKKMYLCEVHILRYNNGDGQ